MNIDINKSRNFVLSVICILFIVFTIVFISVVSLASNGLIKNENKAVQITDNKTDIYGNNLHGYIELSPLWNEVKSNEDDQSLYFKSRDGYLLTMSAFDTSKTKAVDLSNTLYKSINNTDYSGVELTNERINGYVAYKVVGYNLKVGKWLYTWAFEDTKSITHFISIEGNEKDSRNFLIPLTYKNNK